VNRLTAARCRYGFTHFMTVDQLHASHPAAFPDRPPLANSQVFMPYHTDEMRIEAMFGFLDPKDYQRDLQVCSSCWSRASCARPLPHIVSHPAMCSAQLLTDVLRSRGRIADELEHDEPQLVDCYTSCPDFLYANEHPVPRYGAGIFTMLLEHLFQKSTGRVLRATEFGKPLAATYRCVGHVACLCGSAAVGSCCHKSCTRCSVPCPTQLRSPAS